MNFELSEAQAVIATSAADVLRGTQGAPDELWPALAKAGLLALTLPGWMGGDDLGVLEAAVLVTEVGRRAASVPALATVMLGALPVVRWGARELQERLLAGVAEGETILTAGVREQSAGMPDHPATIATLDESGTTGSVTGTKVGVPYAAQARWILVPANIDTGDAAVVVVVDAAGPGVTIVPGPTSGSAPDATVRLDGAPIVGVLGAGQQEAGARAAAVDDLYLLADAGAAAMAAGAVAGALDLTAKYIATREQFGRPLATFQAVAG